MKLILVRHGETEENKQGILLGQSQGVLTKEGIESAKKLATTLQSKNIDYVVSSDLKRCIDTTDILLSSRELEADFDGRLREINFGEFQGKPYGVIADDYSADLDLQFPSGESNRQMITRVTDCVNELLATHSEETVLIVSHSGPISVILAALHGITFIEALTKFKIENTEFVKIEVNSPLSYPA